MSDDLEHNQVGPEELKEMRTTFGLIVAGIVILGISLFAKVIVGIQSNMFLLLPGSGVILIYIGLRLYKAKSSQLTHDNQNIGS